MTVTLYIYRRLSLAFDSVLQPIRAELIIHVTNQRHSLLTYR